MSSHREAPEISKDPAADNTDVYAFVSPDKPDTVTLVANFIPFQNPDGGPNFYAFGTDVLYEIKIHNKPIIKVGQLPDITYGFRFTEEYVTPDSFLYNTSTVGVTANAAPGETYPNLNRVQTYTVTKNGATLASGIPVPPCNVGIHSTPNYTQYVPPALKSLGAEGRVFAGQRADPFYVDLGAVFDLADLRPLQILHTGPLFPAPGVDSFQGINVFSIVLQVPKTSLTADGLDPTNVMSPNSVIGVYASASRAAMTLNETNGDRLPSGPLTQQVSRLGNPLFNEVLIGIADKNRWNSQSPTNDAQFLERALNPELARELPALYPLAFRNLAYYNTHNVRADGKQRPERKDIAAILLTGLPPKVIPNFQNTTGSVPADLLRLNMAVPPTKNPNNLGVIAGDLQGYPNGRRLADDVATIELRALAGATLPLTDGPAGGNFVTDIAVNLVSDYSPISNGPFLPTFPYLATPSSGFGTMPRPYAPN